MVSDRKERIVKLKRTQGLRKAALEPKVYISKEEIDQKTVRARELRAKEEDVIRQTSMARAATNS